MRSPLPWLVLSCRLKLIVLATGDALPGRCQDEHCALDAACFVQSAGSHHSSTSAGEFLDGREPLADFGEEVECKRSPVQKTHLFKSGSFEQNRNFEFLIGRENIQPWPRKSLRGLYLWDYFVPEVACPNVDRIGRIGDGGKWVCDIEVLAKRGGSSTRATGRSSPPCSVFSYGVGWDVSFELELIQAAPACSIHLFDPTVGRLPQEVQPYMFGGTRSNMSSGAHPPVSFHKVGLASTSGGIAASGSADFPLVESLVDAMQRVGVDFIDVLKVDVEGAEYASLLPLLQQRRPGVDPPLFGQLLIELHAKEGEEKAAQGTSAHDIFELIDLLGKHGYRIFSKELNLGPTVEGRPPIGIEYSLIHPEAWSNASCSRSVTTTQSAESFEDSRSQPEEHEGSGAQAPFGQFPRHVDGGGVIYFFTNAGRLSIFRETLKALHVNFNWEYRYPVVVFHESITPEQQQVLQEEVAGGLYKLRFIDLVKEQAGMVLPPLPSTTEAACGSLQQARVPQKSTFHAFLAPELLHQRFGYSWAWHLDDDTEIQAPIGYDPFQLMAVNGWRYGATATVMNAVECMAGLWDLASNFAANHSQDLVHGVHFLRQLVPGMAFSEGFELSHESLWTSKIYTQWRKEVLQYWVSSGRSAAWGDAVAASLRAVGVAMVLHPSEVHRFADVGFRHTLMEQKAQGLHAAGAPKYDRRDALASAEKLLNALPWVGAPLPQQAQYVTVPDVASSSPARLLEVLSASSQRLEGWAGLSLQPERVANAQSAGWIGGDVGALVSLPPIEGSVARAGAETLEKRRQLLWLFRDTMLGTSRRGVPTHLEKVLRQSAGRSAQRLNSTTPLLFEWAADDGLQESGDLFPCTRDRHSESSQCFYWPVAGVSVFDGVTTDAKNVRLIVLANRMQNRQSIEEPEVLGSSVIVVKNPFDHASQWIWEVRDMPGDDISWCGGISALDGAFPSAADGHNDLIYLMGRARGIEGSDAGAVVARIGAKDLLALRLHRLAVARRNGRGMASLWTFMGDEQAATTEFATIFTPAPTEFSLLWSPELKAWLTAGLVEPEHGGHGMTLLTLRAAPAPEGPWGKPAVVGALAADSALGKCHAVKLFQADPADSGNSGATLLVSVVCRPLSMLQELPDQAAVPIIYKIPLHASDQ